MKTILLMIVDNIANCFTSSVTWSEFHCLQHYVHCQYCDSHCLEFSSIVNCWLNIVLECFILLQTMFIIVDCFNSLFTLLFIASIVLFYFFVHCFHFIVHCFILLFIVSISLFNYIVYCFVLLFIVLFYCLLFILIVHCLHFVVEYECCVYCCNIVLIVTIF